VIVLDEGLLAEREAFLDEDGIMVVIEEFDEVVVFGV
jgi:hypothetical protein